MQSWHDLTKYKTPRFHKSVWKRIAACIKETEHKEMLRNLDMNLKALERIGDDSLTLEPIRVRRRQKTRTGRVDTIRRYAKSLHGAMLSKWPCDCVKEHYAHLLLDDQCLRSEAEVRFQLVISSERPGVTGVSSPWAQKEIEVEPHEQM
jgi:hypothetical protein